MADNKVTVEFEGKNKTGPAMKAVGKGLGNVQNQAKNMGKAFTVAGAAITGAMLLSVRSFAKTGDEIHKMALRTSMSTEALSEWGHVAELGGGSLTTIEKATKRMTATLYDAGLGLKTATDSLDDMGVSAEQLKGLGVSEQFDIMTAALAGVEDESTQAALAQKVFGRAGMELLPMLSAGAGALAAQRQEAHLLGKVYTQEMANAAAELNDSMTRLKGTTTSMTNTIATALVPSLTKAIKQATEGTKKIVTWTKANPKLTDTITKLTLGLGLTLAVLGPLLYMLPQIITGVQMLGAAMTGALGPIGLVIIGLSAMAWGVSQLISRHKDEVVAIRDAARERDFWIEKAMFANTVTFETIDAKHQEANAWRAVDGVVKEASDSVKTYVDAAQSGLNEINRIAAQIIAAQQNIAARGWVEAQIAGSGITGVPVYDPGTGFYETDGGEGDEFGKYHSGGTVPGPKGRPVQVTALGGEVIGYAGKPAGGTIIHVHVQGSIVTEDMLLRKVREGLLEIAASNTGTGIAE